MNINEWVEKFDKLSKKISSSTGLIYELYQQELSKAIDNEIANINENDRLELIEIARTKFDYISHAQRIKAIETSNDEGLCKHFLDPNVCPMGCGDL